MMIALALLHLKAQNVLNFCLLTSQTQREDREIGQATETAMAQRQNPRPSWPDPILLNYQRRVIADRVARLACALPVRSLSLATAAAWIPSSQSMLLLVGSSSGQSVGGGRRTRRRRGVALASQGWLGQGGDPGSRSHGADAEPMRDAVAASVLSVSPLGTRARARPSSINLARGSGTIM